MIFDSGFRIAASSGRAARALGRQPRRAHISAIRHPQSAVRRSKSRRRGASILEVLFAILITTVGLLGAVSVFPVAGAYARKARNADAMSSAGRAAVGHFDARGMRRATEQWLVWNTTVAPNAFTRLTPAAGLSYCIDPRFIAANNTASSTDAHRTAARVFPYSAQGSDPQMFRLTLWSGLTIPGTPPTPLPMGLPMANSIFQLDDDLMFLRPGEDKLSQSLFYAQYHGDGSVPALQQFATMAADPTTVTRRQSQGNFSWMATVVPKLDRNTVASATNDLYVLSIVMFHQRPMVDFSIDTAASDSDVYEYSERVLDASFFDTTNTAIGDGVGGGPVRLTLFSGPSHPIFDGSADEAKEYLRVRPGDWLLLACQTTFPPAAGVYNRFQWFRVSDCDSEPTRLGDVNSDGVDDYELYVSLVGRDWNVQATRALEVNTNQRAIIVDRVIGVFEKTIRLETGGVW